ncbi:peroxide stress protein YaaA [Desulfomarina sp.]
MLLILAPSKTQAFNGRDFPLYFQPLFPDKTESLINQLQAMSKDELATILKTSRKLTETTYERIHSFQIPLRKGRVHQAFFTFQGDVYRGIGTDSYNKDQLQYCQDHIFILSGLYGILRPLDLMHPYRLEMGTKLVTGNGKNLYHFWSDHITEEINRTLLKTGSNTVINLASTEYSRTILKKKLQGKRVDVVFQQKKNSIYRTIPIHAKRARGYMTDFAVKNGIEKAEYLKEFDLEGYRFQPRDSTELRWLFRQEKETQGQ